MSTATWDIVKDDAALIAREDDRKLWNLNRAWVSHPALENANQYEWAAWEWRDGEEAEGEIICWRCAVQELLDEARPTATLFTYELSEEELCGRCYEIYLGGSYVPCECCENSVLTVPYIHTESTLWGQYSPYSEGGGAVLLNADGTVNSDDRDMGEEAEGRWVCDECLEEHYTYDLTESKYIRK